jgi:hypothetical protein
LHANPYSSKFPSLTRERDAQFGRALAQQRGGRAARSTQFELRRPRVENTDVSRQRRREGPMDEILQRGFTPVALQQLVECGFAFEYLMESAHGTVSAKRFATEVRGRTPGESVI